MGKKLHVGSGTVYLENYINVDMAGTSVFLASTRPDLVERYKTTEDRYYARHQDKTIETVRQGPREDEYVCDVYGSFERLPCGIGEAEEILARHSFEHLSIQEARRALDEMDRVLANGGILRLDVPDHEGSLKLYKETGDAFYVRHMLGPRRGDHGYHMMGYTRDSLQKLVEEFGFILVQEEPNIHFYPSICLKFQKPYIPLPRDYALRSVRPFPKDWIIGDLGPGPYPLEEAKTYIDKDRDNLARLLAMGKEAVFGDVEETLPFGNGHFDFLFVSHVLEHVKDPVRCLIEISRISKRGVLVLPHAFKESLFLFEEGDHLWWSFPPRQEGGPVRFMRVDYDLRSKIADSNIQATLCRLFRTGPNRLDHDQRMLRKWYQTKEPYLDVVVPWQNEIKGMYI